MNLILYIFLLPIVLSICWLILKVLRVVNPKEYGKQKFGYPKNLLEGTLKLLFENGYSIESHVNNYDTPSGCSMQYYKHKDPNQSCMIQIRVWYEEDCVRVFVEEGSHEGYGSIEKRTKSEFRYKYSDQVPALLDAQVTKELLEKGHLIKN